MTNNNHQQQHTLATIHDDDVEDEDGYTSEGETGNEMGQLVHCPMIAIGDGCEWYGPQQMLEEHLENTCFVNLYTRHIASHQLNHSNNNNNNNNMIIRVKDFIVDAMNQYLNKEQIIFHCSQQLNIAPTIASKVWEIIQQINPQFYNAYELRLTLKTQMETYNRLLDEIQVLHATSDQQQPLQTASDHSQTSPIRITSPIIPVSNTYHSVQQMLVSPLNQQQHQQHHHQTSPVQFSNSIYFSQSDQQQPLQVIQNHTTPPRVREDVTAYNFQIEQFQNTRQQNQQNQPQQDQQNQQQQQQQQQQKQQRYKFVYQ
jgi:uncharacterized protein (TIGR01589 family)